MNPNKSVSTCNRCDGPLENSVCRKCNVVHCPFCGLPEDRQCTHLLACWTYKVGGTGSRFRHPPFLDGTLPFLTVDDDSPITLLPIDSKTALGELSPLLQAYRGDVFEPPDPVSLFESMVNMVSVPCVRASRHEGGRAWLGDHIFWFASDVTAAKAELTSILFMLWDGITELGHRLNAQFEEQCRNPAVQPALEEVVYGQISDYLVFAKRSDADQLSACYNALQTAQTWGEFRSLVGPDVYDELIEYMGFYFEGTITDFAAFYEELIRCKPDTTPEQAREEYLKLPFGERLPEDKDPLSSYPVPGVDDHDWPAWPAQQMLDWVPKEIREKYGSMESGRLNGEYLTLKPGDERKITAAFRRAGFRCTRDDALILRASGIRA
jgi:hypothetical protein